LVAPSRPCAYPLPDCHFDLETEQALLIDPADRRIDPLDHMRWRNLYPEMPPALWKFGIRGFTPQGRATVRILRLDERASFVNAAYIDAVWPRFRREIFNKVKTKRAALTAAWSQLGRDLIGPQVEFAAAKWCMLDALRTSSKALSRLKLPEPPRPKSALAD
jgi:hypothetical protein